MERKQIEKGKMYNLQLNVREFYKNLLRATHLKRLAFFLFFDIAIIIFSLYFSFFIRFEFTIPLEYRQLILDALPYFIGINMISFACFKIYGITWSYINLNDLVDIALSQIVSLLSLMTLISVPFLSFFNAYLSFDIRIREFPGSIFLIYGIISFLLFSGLRLSKRLFLEVFHKKSMAHSSKRTLIIGAGNTGDMIVRDMRKQGYLAYYPVGWLDDNQNKVGTYIHGMRVFGTVDKLRGVVSAQEIRAIIIAIPSLNYKTLRGIYESAKQLKIDTIKIVPRIYDFHRPNINIKNLEDIHIEDLLGRQKIEIDYEGIRNFLDDKVILITGAGGSIGSEIVVQVCSFRPKRVILFDIDETELHNVKLKLESLFPDFFHIRPLNAQIQDKVIFVTGDIGDEYVVNEVFRKFKPKIVFHAAAYKHVPMMESNSREAVKVNMFGTYRIAKASAEHQVEKFTLISTDKAVCPTSIMGATKRMAEYICTAFNNEYSNTSFISVRFGNVLGSRGSVLPIFLEQLKQGGPLKVTHKDVQRYFMTIPEAVALVLQSSIIGKGGDVLVFDMGEQIKIVTLAEELIKLHGLQPYKDIDIEFVGLRPGEKLFEELLTAEEGTAASKHEKIFIAKNSEKYCREEIEKILKGFEKLLKALPIKEDYEIIRDTLKSYVKSFERRGQKRTGTEIDVINNAIISQDDERDSQYREIQFEALLKELPIIEGDEIIRSTLRDYTKSLRERRQYLYGKKESEVTICQ